MWYISLICDVTRWYVTCLTHIIHDSFICDVTDSYVTSLIYMWHGSLLHNMPDSYEILLIHMGHDLIIWDMRHDSFAHAISDMTREHGKDEWHDSVTWHRIAWLIHVRHHWGHDSFTKDTAHSQRTWLIHVGHDSFMLDMTYSHDKDDTLLPPLPA